MREAPKSVMVAAVVAVGLAAAECAPARAADEPTPATGAKKPDEKKRDDQKRREEQRAARAQKEREQRAERFHPTGDMILRRLDADKDGKVSKDEFLREAYEKYAGGKGKQADGKKAKGADKDMDGKISYEEFQALPPAQDRWKKLDKDGSGFLEGEELTAMAEGLGREQRQKLPEFVSRYDDNGDGKVTRDEMEGPDAVFARLDRNGDGVLTAADAVEAPVPASPPAPPSSPNPPAAPGAATAGTPAGGGAGASTAGGAGSGGGVLRGTR